MKELVAILSIMTIINIMSIGNSLKPVSNINPTYQLEKHQSDEEKLSNNIHISERNLLLNQNASGLDTDIWWPEMPNNIYSGMVSWKYAEYGMPAYRFELRRNDYDVNNGKRSEISKIIPETPLEENTYYFDILLPSGGNEEYLIDPKCGDILVQWHNVPDPGEEWTIPPLALQTYGERYKLHLAWDKDKYSTTSKILSNGQCKEYDLGSLTEDKGRYVQWAFHVKWGWEKSQDPILEVYKDGEKILDLSGQPNTMNDEHGVCQKIGIYKSSWTEQPESSIIDRRVVYYNNVHVE
ncbi:MAG: hypothetical protein HPY50_06665 [Firmicutes bacterium]|nr:hypothetical protein [Bacillota bacterium]